jgi:prepilin-type N-terminal cleavage/methylation domain-containing protein/prepilin-type processing-associated H-X9-DG protein
VQGFTLIELLIVISIIALLVSILLPSMQRAREQGKIIACQSNLRQIVVGVFDYANAYGDRMPVAAAHELGGPKGRVGIDDPWLPARMFGGGLPADKRPMNARLGHVHATFKCPSDQGEPLWWFDTEPYQDSATAYELYGSSYFYMSGHNRMSGVVSPMGLAKFVGLDFSYELFQSEPLPNGKPLSLNFYPQPSKKVVIGDIPIHRTMPGVIAPNPRAQWHRRDRDHLWANAAFVDGHAEFVRVFPYDSPPYQGVQSAPSPWNPYY